MSGARRLMLSGIGLTALLAVVAVSSRSHKPGGGSGASAAHPPRIIWEYLASMMIILLPIGAMIIFWGLAHSRRQKVLSGERSWRRTMALLITLIPVFVGAAFLVRHFRAPPRPPSITTPAPEKIPKNHKPAGTKRQPNLTLNQPSNPHFQWLAAAIFGSLIIATVGTIGIAIAWKRSHGEEWAEEAAMIQAIDEVLADTLDDLRAEQDPRKAVIRTYARMEKTFAAYGAPRELFEAPQEYVSRVLDRLGVSAFSVRRITDLFSRAKFSPHEIDAGMKGEAIDALAGLRAELEHKEGEEAA
jgi:membrane protease YdiL (CAAX protease family)